MPYTTNKYVVAAICGNFWQESTVNPGIWEGLTVGAPGFGLGQWTDSPGVVYRRTALFNYLDSHGYARDSGDGQLEFLIYENSWLVNGAGYVSSYSSLTDFLNSSSTNLSDLTYEFFHSWEGINDGTGPVRLEYAERWLELIDEDDGIRRPWYTSNSYNNVAEAGFNVLRIKDFLMGTTPVPPTPPTPPTDEEIIAMVRQVLKRRKNGGVIIVF